MQTANSKFSQLIKNPEDDRISLNSDSDPQIPIDQKQNHQPPISPSYFPLHYPPISQNAKTPKYKTQLCKNYMFNGWCFYEDKCQFAHGADDVCRLAMMNKNPSYKTKKCKNFWQEGKCKYGDRCHFVHHQFSYVDKACLIAQKYLSGEYQNEEPKESRLLKTLNVYGNK